MVQGDPAADVPSPCTSPIHFAFTTDYDDDAVPKCPHCRTYLFPQEVSIAVWCCKKGQMLSLYKPWTQPTDEYRNLCIGNFPDAKLFRLHSRALNLTFSFAVFGIKYGAVDQSFAPPYSMKVNGMPYWRMLFANNASEPPASPLHMYIYDSDRDYNIKDTLLPQRLRDVVKRCMLQTNDLAQKLRNLANEHNVEEACLHINCDWSIIPWSIIPIALQIADKNSLFDAAFSTGNNINPTLWSIIAEDGPVTARSSSSTSWKRTAGPHRSSRHSRHSRPSARRRSPRSILTEGSRNAALMFQFASLATFKFVSIII